MNSECIVIKVGSSTAVEKDQPETLLRAEVLRNIFEVVLRLQEQCNHQVVVVISGAVAAGRMLGRSSGLATRQAFAAVGQWKLNGQIDALLPKKLSVGLILLSREDIVNRKRFLALQATFHDLLTHGVVPVINENDATTIENKNDFPDNDHLASCLAVTLNADRLFLLTNVDGVLSGHPNDPTSQLLPVVENVNVELLRIASNGSSELGRGGMVGKLQAARLATSTGIPTHIIHGEHPEYILDILSGAAAHGTVCLPRSSERVSLSNRDRWLIASKNADGYLQVDAGASRAIQQRRSLLAVGIKEVYGSFNTGDTVEIIDHNRETLAIAQVDMNDSLIRTFIHADAKPFDTQVAHADNIILICAGDSCHVK